MNEPCPEEYSFWFLTKRKIVLDMENERVKMQYGDVADALTRRSLDCRKEVKI